MDTKLKANRQINPRIKVGVYTSKGIVKRELWAEL